MQITANDTCHCSNFTIITDDKLKLHGFCLKPKKPICSLIVLHGVGEHSERYTSFAKKICTANGASYFYDQRGHGHSDGKRGHIAAFESYASDLSKVFDLVYSESQGRPIFIYGHSMGSIVATLFTLQHQEKIKGLILTGFPFKPSIPITGFILRVIQFLGKTIPLLNIPTLINVKHLSHDKKVWDDYDQDPMINKTVTFSWIAEFYSTIESLGDKLIQLKLPLLIMHGGGDKVARVEGAEEAVQAISSKDKTFRIFDGQRHELLNELPPTPDQVINLIIDWIQHHL